MVDRSKPWFGGLGYGLCLLAFVVGSAFLTWLIWTESDFMAQPVQLAAAAVAAILAAGATLFARQPIAPAVAVPHSSTVIALTGFAASSLFMLTDELNGWQRLAGGLLIAALFGLWLDRQARAASWTHRQTISLVGGLLATYAWLGALMTPQSGPKSPADHIGTVLLVVMIYAIWLAAWKRTRPI